MKKLLSIILILVLVLSGCIKTSQEKSFEKFLDELFIYFVGDDPMDINFTLYEPDNFKIKEGEVTKLTSIDNYDDLERYKNKLLKYDKLTKKESILTKDILIDYLDRLLAFKPFPYYGTMLESYIGYQAQLPIILAEYRFDDMGDILNYFEYLRVTKDSFAELIAYEKEKAERNMGLPDRLLDKTIASCEEILNSEENFLTPVFNEKIDSLEFLTEFQRKELKETNEELINNDFLGAYEYLREELEKLKGNAKHTGALANFPNGRQYYEVLFQRVTGSDMTVLEAKAFIEKIVTEKMMDYIKNSIDYTRVYETTIFMKDLKRDTLIPFFIKKMKKDFPIIEFEVNYEIKEIHPSMQQYSAPAMYLVSPIDDNRDEVIYVNPLHLEKIGNYMYQTIAHEGFPGHLYQNVYLKNSDLPEIRKILYYPGYTEGWATYVENYVVKYASTLGGVKVFEFFNSIDYLIMGLCDIGINYQGWDLETLKEFLAGYYVLTDEQIEDIYYDLVEVPTNYLQYYFSYYYLLDIKERFEETMGREYSDYVFHKIYLDTGPAPFSIIEAQYEAYKNEIFQE